MSSADTAQPPPLEDPKIVTPSSSSAASSASPPDGTATEDSSKSSPGLSPSTWKPNADAAEWKPTFSTVSAPVPAVGGDSDGTKVDDGEEKRGKALGEGGATDAGVGDVKEGGRGDGKRKVAEEKSPVGDDEDSTEAKLAGDSDAASGPAADGSSKPGTGEKETPVANGDTGTGKTQGGRRYEIDFLLSLRPKPEGTPRPKGLNPPERVDILWDGKEPTLQAKSSGSIRGGIRPLPPLTGRQGPVRGLGDARGAPPPLRGAQQSMGRDRDNRMDQRGGLSREDSRRGGNDRGRGGGGGGNSRRAPVDTAPALEDCEPIKINEATRWKPKSLEGKDASKRVEGGLSQEEIDAAKMTVEEVLMKAKAILNKMTLEKFGRLSEGFMKVGLRDERVVAGVIDMLVEKAQMEPHFSSMYAQLCERIARTPIPGLGEDPSGKDASKGSRKFRKMLLIKCQAEFEKDWPAIFLQIQNDADLADDEKAEKEFITKRKYTGHMRFVGELYKVELLKEKHVHVAIQDMFGSADNPDEERLECMVKLLQTCGKKLEQSVSPETAKDMKRLFKRIAKLADSRVVSSRIRFMLRDLIELRKNHWVPRREEEKAKTMQELHNDIAKEEESKNRRSGGSSHHHGSGGGSGSSSIRPGSGDARLSSNSRNESSVSSVSRPTTQAAKPKDDDGWETVPKKGKGASDGWNQVGSRRGNSNPGSDERRDGGSGGSGGGIGGASAFALLGGDDEKEKKKKKKDSKDRKEKSSKSSKDKKRDKTSKSSSKKGSSSSASPNPTAAFPVAADKPPVPPPAAAKSAAMTEETARKKGKDVVAEYAVSAELGEACTCLGEIDSGLRWAAVSEAVSDSLERKAAHRKALGEVLVAGAKGGLLSADVLSKGINDVLEIVPDVCIDVPQAEEYVAAVVSPLSLGGHLSLGPFLATPCEGLLEGGKAASFATLVMKSVKAALVADGMSEDDAQARLAELLGGSLDVSKLAAMLPAICRGSEDKARDLLARRGVSL